MNTFPKLNRSSSSLLVPKKSLISSNDNEVALSDYSL